MYTRGNVWLFISMIPKWKMNKDATAVTAGALPDPPDPPDPPGPAALLDALRGSTRALVQCSESAARRGPKWVELSGSQWISDCHVPQTDAMAMAERNCNCGHSLLHLVAVRPFQVQMVQEIFDKCLQSYDKSPLADSIGIQGTPAFGAAHGYCNERHEPCGLC